MQPDEYEPGQKMASIVSTIMYVYNPLTKTAYTYKYNKYIRENHLLKMAKYGQLSQAYNLIRKFKDRDLRQDADTAGITDHAQTPVHV